MFKRVAKRIRRQQKDEEIGLTGELKEELGLAMTDSDESDSSSDEDGSSDEEEGSAGEEEGSVDEEEDSEDEEQDGEGQQEDEDVEMVDAENVGSEISDGDEDSEGEEHSVPAMSVTEVLTDPVYVVSLDPIEIKACAICPGKLLKNPKMVEVHKSSKTYFV
ncbi:hypothetical protein K474DRAFT_1156125 [Panus rudis PR-1116 ss-1]|nr:hypothetical protein K474DRAFT_1156125 [Panus rudis PR-1116 ss-1]